jgi:heat shock protein HslJ
MKLFLNFLTIMSLLNVISSCSPSLSKSNNDLEGTWVLKNVLMADAMDVPCGFSNEGKVQEMNVSFSSEKVEGNDQMKLHGQSSVNKFMGAYTIISYDSSTKTGKIKFEPIASTKMASINTEFMNCEQRYLSYLEKSVDFKIENEKLQLSITHKLSGNSPYENSYRNVLYFQKSK